jgi:hypothetical protein
MDIPKKKEESKQQRDTAEIERLKKQFEELPPQEKEIMEELKEETLELLWRLCQDNSVIQGGNISIYNEAIDDFTQALSYNQDDIKWKYISKIMDKLQQNDSVISA